MTVASVADVTEPVPKAGLDPASCLRSPPPDERSLLELELRWPGLTGAEARVAARLRLFVLTWDPLEWLPERGEAWATVNGDGDTYELVVYVLRDAVAGTTAFDVARAVGPFGESAVLAGTACEELLAAGAHAQLVAAGRAARLLDGPADDRGRGGPSVTARSAGWEPIGLGAIQDLVQDAFGPVDLDRSTVALSARLDAETDCPACAGGRFGFPGDLADATRAMCRPHREEASVVTTTRIARARRSNPAGWRALGKASARLNDLPEPAPIPPPARRAPATGRNDPCPCGSGRKYKRCCGQRF